jgi:hypothetical protein
VKKVKPAVERASILKGVTVLLPQDPAGVQRYPTVSDLLCPRWVDGTMTRMAGRVSIRVEGSCYRVTIECPTEGLMTSIVLASLVECLDALEAVVASGQAKWQLTYEAAKRSRQAMDVLLE